jgi:hypothetical protein
LIIIIVIININIIIIIKIIIIIIIKRTNPEIELEKAINDIFNEVKFRKLQSSQLSQIKSPRLL